MRNRILVGIFATVLVVGSGVATALVTSSNGPTAGEAVDTTASTGDTVGSTVPTTPGSTIATTPDGSDASKVGDGENAEATDVGRYWDAEECGGDEVMNHGQFVSGQPKGGDARSAAAQSDCGKPLTSVGDDGEGGEDGDGGDAPEVDTPEADGGHAPSDAPGKSGSAPGRNK